MKLTDQQIADKLVKVKELLDEASQLYAELTGWIQIEDSGWYTRLRTLCQEVEEEIEDVMDYSGIERR